MSHPSVYRDEIHACFLYGSYEIDCVAQILVDPDLHGDCFVVMVKTVEAGFGGGDE